MTTLNIHGLPLVRSRFDTTSTAAEVVAGIDLTGRRALVTGGGGGIGAAIVGALAGAGAEVLIADVALEAAQATAAAINATLPATRVTAQWLDLASLAATRAFAAALVAEGRPLDILINNAGVMAPPLTRTADGHELQFGINLLGHFVLTNGVMPLLIAERGARVVSVSSIGHRRAGIFWEDPDWRTRPYDKWDAYGQSKTGCALLAVALEERFGAVGVHANAMNPGGSMTGLQRFMTEAELRAQGWLSADGKFPAHWRTPEQCAATSVWLATAPELDGIGARYFEDCAEAPPHDPARPMKGVKPYALDRADASRLWDLAMAMTR